MMIAQKAICCYTVLMVSAGIKEIDIHGLTSYQAKVVIDGELKRARGDIYRLRIVHGYRSGTALKDFIKKEYKKHPKVLRLEYGLNQGQTELVLREL